MRIATLGDINIDVVLSVDRLPDLGEEVFSEQRIELLGGSAVNTGVVLARLGHRVSVLGAVGDDEPGRRALSRLDSIGLSTSHTVSDLHHPTAMNTILVTPDGERTMVGARGANVTYSNSTGWEHGLDWLHISGYALREGTQRQATIEAIEVAQLAEIPCSLDVPGGVGHQIRDALDNRVEAFSIVAGSRSSLVELTGSEVPIDRLISSGVRRVAMPSGARPLLLAEGSQRVGLTPPRVDSLDATGAGDAMIAGLISATLEGLGLGPSAVMAAAAGAAATLVQGASETLTDPATWAKLLEPARWVDVDPDWLVSIDDLVGFPPG